nr:sigma-54-dependent Fis family transcriptional regulator [Burkholderia sp. Ac-20379]
MQESRVPPAVIAADFSRRRRAADTPSDAPAAPRTLVYLARLPDPVLATFLSQHGWRVVRFGSPLEFARQPAAAAPQAGLLDLRGFSS